MRVSRTETFLQAGLLLAFVGSAAAQGLTVLQPEGPYTQAASGMTFPLAVGDFKRDKVVRYKPDGTDESAGYNRVEPRHEIAGTVYVFPSPRLTSIGSPQNVIEDARARLCEVQFRSVQKEVTGAHPDAKLVREEEVSLVQNGVTFVGHRASYSLTNPVFFGRRQQASRSDATIFCYAGGKWTVEYRFDYPDDYDAGAAIGDFIRDLSWTIRPQ